MQKAHGQAWQAIALPSIVSTRIQILFTPLSGVLFTFPSRYYALSVTCLYLALDDGAPSFPQGASDLVVLGILLEPVRSSFTGLSPSMADFPKSFY